MSHYIVETLSGTGVPREWEPFRSESLDEVRSRTLTILSDLAPTAFDDGAESINAAVKDENGKFVFAAKLSLKTNRLR